MKLYIKNMVSLRCKIVVTNELKKLGITPLSVELGVVELLDPLRNSQMENFKKGLHKLGLEVLEDQKSVLVEKIKNLIIEMVHYSDEMQKVNNSEFIANKLNYDYNYLSTIFSDVTGITIARYIINHKIERAKELLLYKELSLSEIALKLNYSSVAHLSGQFKKITGITPSAYKKNGMNNRNGLDEI